MRLFGAGRLVPASPFDVTWRIFDLMCYQPSITMRLCWQVFAIVIIFLATPSIAGPSYGRGLLQHIQNFNPETFTRPVILVSNETKPQEPDIDIFA